MLILMRKAGEVIIATLPDGTQIQITVVSIDRNRCRIGIQAPKSVRVDREEIHLKRFVKGNRTGTHPRHCPRPKNPILSNA